MTLKKMEKGIYLDPNKIERIQKLDGIIFDCDGVLIDVSNSYNLAIKKTVDFIVTKFASIKIPTVTTEMIENLKKTGGFNDEVDVTYALILIAIASHNMGENFSSIAYRIAESGDSTGIRSVEKQLDNLKIDLSEIKNTLHYPAKRFESPLSSIFDEIFYGTELYTNLYKRAPKFFDGKGMIENDVILVTKKILEELHQRFGRKIAIVTGRGTVSASHSLKQLFDEFDLTNSRFLEDEPREMAKPNPLPLISCIKGLGSKHSLFVGDSTEDYIMAHKAEESGISTLFCGIYGTSKDPEAKRSFLEQQGADLVLESVALLSKTLNLVRA